MCYVLVMAERKYQFERLMPTDNVDLDVYKDAINYIFENPDVKNIAISGAYSARKSSVLASYKKKYSDIRFLHINTTNESLLPHCLMNFFDFLQAIVMGCQG